MYILAKRIHAAKIMMGDGIKTVSETEMAARMKLRGK
jgi:hypothetical protein